MHAALRMNAVHRPPLTPLEIMGSLVRTLIGWTFLGLVTLLFLPVQLLLRPSRVARIRVFNLYGHLTGRVMVFMSGASIPPGVQEKLRARQPAIFISNHTSYLDIFLSTWASPYGTLGTAKKETIWVPFFGLIYALSGHILVNRGDRRAAAMTLREITGLLQRHRLNAMLWPEGTRSTDGRLLPFKRGFAHLALATRLPIVPIVVSHAHQCWPKGSPLTRRTQVGVQILAPISTEHWTAATLERHVAEVESLFAAALPEAQRPVSTNSLPQRTP
jgi:1-acyl-sn-glycerol-3-phosphate acyltransferase